MVAQAERRQFETEAAQILDLMTHAVYTNRDTFLRELISNASDAIDRRNFALLTDETLRGSDVEDCIFLKIDADARTLTVRDTGIGMTRDEVIQNIGTIAHSGSKEFLKALRENQKSIAPPDLIGQFGVGFYAAFMVADRVVLDTLKAGTSEPVRWESTGDGTYTLGEGERRSPGTTITLYLKAEDAEAGIRDYTAAWTLKDIVKRYSDFVAYPIKMNVTREAATKDKDGTLKGGDAAKIIAEVETLNSMQAIWTRSPADVTDDEYNEFYRHISHDWQPPRKHLVVKAEGAHAYRSVLFIPEKAPLDLYHVGGQAGVKLYVRRVFIMDDCRDLLPTHLRFVRGVVDAEDLPLNISREMLQENRVVSVIRRHLNKKVLETLQKLKTDDASAYETFWQEFGRVLKEGLYQDEDGRERLLGLLLAHSTRDGKLTSLDDYVGRMKDDQEAIYYITGSSLDALKSSPHLEGFTQRGYEVLLFADPVDEIWCQRGATFADKPLQSVGKGEVALGSEQERQEEEKALEDKTRTHRDLLGAIRATLQDDVKTVRLSHRMTSSAACLVGETNDLSPQLVDMLRAMGQSAPTEKRTLELNPSHPLLQSLQTLYDKDPKSAVLQDCAKLLLATAQLAEGGQVKDPGAFGQQVAHMMARALGAES